MCSCVIICVVVVRFEIVYIWYCGILKFFVSIICGYDLLDWRESKEFLSLLRVFFWDFGG